MQKALITYFSQGGTTKQVADQIASGLKSKKYQVDMYNIIDNNPPDYEAYDVIGFGSPVYVFQSPFNFMNHIKNIPNLKDKPVFTFFLFGTFRGETSTAVRRLLSDKGARDAGTFYARGADYFLGYLKKGYLFSPESPTKEELKHAKTFGNEVAGHIKMNNYTIAEYDPPPIFMLRLEKFLMKPWLMGQIYSRLYSISKKKCTKCGVCKKVCPMDNISENKKGYPVVGTKCLLCLYCEMRCPEDAITSPVTGLTFKFFIWFNIRHTLKFSKISYSKVVHKKGKVRHLADLKLPK